MDRDIIKKYARLIVRTGANVQKGQGVVINAAVDQYEFVNYLTEEAYEAGAGWVSPEWRSQDITILNNRYQTVEALSLVPKWREEKMQYWVDENPCRISILSEDPDGLSHIDKDKMQISQVNIYKVLKKYYDAMENKHQWTVAAVPSEKWAAKVFPGESAETAVEKLWEAILKTVYIDGENDAEERWKIHNRTFEDRCAKLNSMDIKYLHYKNGLGTDLKVGLIPRAKWMGGGETALNGVFFNPNLPTEEIFTTPMRGMAEGRVVASKPLSWQGHIIKDFYIDFKNGKVCSAVAEKGREALEKMISMDEGASYIGELALIPFNSPIADTGILFYETLFDENASCHIALGSGFSNALPGYEDMSKEDALKAGINDSMIHVDFMIGTEDLQITAFTGEGKNILIFKNGNWSI